LPQAEAGMITTGSIHLLAIVASDGALHRGVAASVATLSHFAPQPHRGEARKGDKPFAQIRQEWIGALLLVRPRTIGRRLQTARDIFADGVTVDAELTGNGSNLQALPMKLS
jgi:hypothetical protein